jgi:hypothetical protein
MVLEPGPFAHVTPWTPLAPIQDATAFVTRGAPYLATVDTANAAIQATRSAIAPFVTSDVATPFTTEVVPAMASIGGLAAPGDDQELGAILGALDGVLGDVGAQQLDLPGPESEAPPPEPVPGPPPGSDRD